MADALRRNLRLLRLELTAPRLVGDRATPPLRIEDVPALIAPWYVGACEPGNQHDLVHSPSPAAATELMHFIRDIVDRCDMPLATLSALLDMAEAEGGKGAMQGMEAPRAQRRGTQGHRAQRRGLSEEEEAIARGTLFGSGIFGLLRARRHDSWGDAEKCREIALRLGIPQILSRHLQVVAESDRRRLCGELRYNIPFLLWVLGYGGSCRGPLAAYDNEHRDRLPPDFEDSLWNSPEQEAAWAEGMRRSRLRRLIAAVDEGSRSQPEPTGMHLLLADAATHGIAAAVLEAVMESPAGSFGVRDLLLPALERLRGYARGARALCAFRSSKQLSRVLNDFAAAIHVSHPHALSPSLRRDIVYCAPFLPGLLRDGMMRGWERDPSIVSYVMSRDSFGGTALCEVNAAAAVWHSALRWTSTALKPRTRQWALLRDAFRERLSSGRSVLRPPLGLLPARAVRTLILIGWPELEYVVNPASRYG